MRVNLRTERRHFILLLADATLIDFLNQLTDTRQHLVKAARQITDLISFRRNQLYFQISFVYLSHCHFQPFKAVCHISGKFHNYDRREKDAARPHQKNHQKNRLHRADDAFFRQIARSMPSILLNLLFQKNVVRCILLLFFLYLLKIGKFHLVFCIPGHLLIFIQHLFVLVVDENTVILIDRELHGAKNLTVVHGNVQKTAFSVINQRHRAHQRHRSLIHIGIPVNIIVRRRCPFIIFNLLRRAQIRAVRNDRITHIDCRLSDFRVKIA